jgi:spore maturation protein CgeB
MKLVIFGLSASSSWGNGHASLWRGLIAALLQKNHQVVFFERDMPWYASNRDITTFGPGGDLVLYSEWSEILPRARQVLADADVGIVTSFCPDGVAAGDLLRESRALRCFYDLDTPVTLARLEAGEDVPWLGADGLAGYELVLSYTGGGALTALRTRLGAKRVVAFHGWADPAIYRAVPRQPQYAALLSYLGTYAADRQPALERLLVEPARRRSDDRFVIGGALYPTQFPWAENIFFVRHLPPAEHAAFYSSARLTLNITRVDMARMGWCPSGRLFEAACCGTPVLSDQWLGLEDFFEPGREILVANDTREALAALDLPDEALRSVASRARSRVLDEHTAAHRARTMISLFETTRSAVEA